MTSRELKSKLQRVREIFNVEDILHIDGSDNHIQKYYKTNQIAYTLFNPSSGFIHFGLSEGDTLKKDDLEVQARYIDTLIPNGTKKVLELACGRGANSLFLAKRNPDTTFIGIDISDGQLEYAYKRTKDVSNTQIKKANFHDLRQFDSNSFQIVFIIEALCYSNNVSKVLNEVYRVLDKGGLFIVYDGYVNRRNVDKDEQVACDLVEKGMAVDRFSSYSEFIKKVQNSKFKIKNEEDLTKKVLPTLKRFNKIASLFFMFPVLSRFMKKFLPDIFLYNAVSGYLMYTLAKEGTAEYHLTVLEK